MSDNREPSQRMDWTFSPRPNRSLPALFHFINLGRVQSTRLLRRRASWRPPPGLGRPPPHSSLKTPVQRSSDRTPGGYRRLCSPTNAHPPSDVFFLARRPRIHGPLPLMDAGILLLQTVRLTDMLSDRGDAGCIFALPMQRFCPLMK